MHNGAIFALGKPEDLPETARFLTDDLQGRFIVSVGTDRRHETGCFEVNNVFGLDPQKVFLVLRTEVEVSEASVPSITPIIPGANWAEREVRDMIGITPLGHPDLRRLVLPDDWPEGIYPLRRDFRFDEHPAPAQGNQPAMKPLPPGSSVLPLGPFFPTLEEPVFISLFVHGEKITGMDYRGFYNHRGVEKLADSALTYQQIPFLAERICGICPHHPARAGAGSQPSFMDWVGLPFYRL
jgi:Ni,Fe-hydrogenase III component G